MIRKLLLAGAALGLAVAVTTDAMASDQKATKRGNHVGRIHTAASGGTHRVSAVTRSARFRGPENWNPGSGSPPLRGGFIDLGPLGTTAACGSYPRRHGYCGPGYGTPIDARW